VVSQQHTSASPVLLGPDFFAHFKNNPGHLTADNLHPSQTGYTAMAKLWSRQLCAELDSVEPPIPTPAPTGTPSPTPVPPSDQIGPTIRVNLWEDEHQSPALPTTDDPYQLDPTDNRWTELQSAGRAYPGIFSGTNEQPPLLRFSAPVPNGRYRIVANLLALHSVRYTWGYTDTAPGTYAFQVPGGVDGFAEYTLGTVDVTDGSFELYTQGTTLPSGATTPRFSAWSWISLVPISRPEPTVEPDTRFRTSLPCVQRAP